MTLDPGYPSRYLDNRLIFANGSSDPSDFAAHLERATMLDLYVLWVLGRE